MSALKENNFTHIRTGDIRESATREVAPELSLEMYVGVNQVKDMKISSSWHNWLPKTLPANTINLKDGIASFDLGKDTYIYTISVLFVFSAHWLPPVTNLCHMKKASVSKEL